MPVKQPDKDGCCDVMLDTLATSGEPTLPGTVASKASPSVCLDSETPATCSVSTDWWLMGGENYEEREKRRLRKKKERL